MRLRSTSTPFAGAGLVLTLLASCYPESAPSSPQASGGSAVATRGGMTGQGGSGQSGGEPAAQGGTAPNGGAPVVPEGGSSQGGGPSIDLPARFTVFHALPGSERVEIFVDADPSGALEIGSASEEHFVPSGAHVIRAVVEETVLARAELDVPSDGKLALVLVPSARGPRFVTLDLDDPPDASGSVLSLIHAATAGAVDVDVGGDDPKDPDLALDRDTAGSAPLEPTRAALVLAAAGREIASFTLDRPGPKERVIAVLLGDARAPSDGADALRVLAFHAASSRTILADPVVYAVHASRRHAGLDVFTLRGNPRLEMSPSIGAACAPDLGENAPKVLAELVDNLRFGELGRARLPPGPTTLQIFATIPGVSQPPSPVLRDLAGALLPNQRLRDGSPIACQGAQIDPSSELAPGGRYLLLVPANPTLRDNREKYAPLAPLVPFERLAAPRGVPHFELRVALNLGGARVTMPGQPPLVQTLATQQFAMSAVIKPLAIKHHQLTLEFLNSEGNVIDGRQLGIDPKPGSRLLIVAAGDSQAPIAIPPVAAARADDSDADGAVASSVDSSTGALTQPNYLPPDGDSALVQDDCPTVPGTVFGCPAPPLTWLVIDLSEHEPKVGVYPMQ